MKCPKCGYVGFEHAHRCRNCGYDFSLSSTLEAPDLPMRSSRGDAVRPLDDLTLLDAALPPALPSVLGSREAGPELPLFALPPGLAGDDAPLITRASAPRTPLAVRRSTPDVPRLRTEPRAPMLDLGSAERAALPSRAAAARNTDWAHAVTGPSPAPRPFESASPAARLVATAIDVVLLAAVDVAIVYFTLQICGLGLDELALVPKAPLVAFFTLQNVGYFIAFTAGGCTLGQMAAGIKVVAADAHAMPGLRHAAVRTVVWLALAIPAGIGLLSVLFSRDHRGFHDHCAGTRVVRAGA